MKNWKKLLACLLVGLMALTVFTACDASVGAPMGPEHSNAESASVKALCDRFKVSYSEELSNKAYYVASWVASYPGSCNVNPEKPELFWEGTIGNDAKAQMKIGRYADAFDLMGIGKGIGGGMANTFLAAQGYGIGKSLVEADKIDLAKQLINQAKEQGTKLLLPVDVMVAAEFKNDADHKVVPVDAVPADWMILDVGMKTQELFAKELAPMKLIVWNGPMGVFEMENYAKGTEAVAKAVADSDAVSIVGGGDSVSAVNKTGLADKISHISTGGGASLEYLEGKQLPGVVSLSDK